MRALTSLTVAVLMWSPVLDAQTTQDPVEARLQGERDVIATAAQLDRFETERLILYIDKGILSADASRQFVNQLERSFVAVSQTLDRRFEADRFKVPKPTFYLTERAGISHVNAARVFLRASRVVDSPAIAVHEIVHLLVGNDPNGLRHLSVTPRDVEASTGIWLAEGFASHVSTMLAPRLGLPPERLFLKGDDATVHAEAAEWLNDPRGTAVLPYVASRGFPQRLLADRVNVAPPFYVLSQSFVKFMATFVGLPAMTRLYDEHFNGRGTIEDDVRRVTRLELTRLRVEWLRVLGQ